MSAYRKTDAKDPSLFGVFFCALFVALVGALSGFILLASISPKPFGSVAEYESSLSENSKPKLLDAHYFKGSISSLDNWALKREILLNVDDRTLELSDSEINAWMVKKFKPNPISFLDEKKTEIVITPKLPNFFINTDEGVHFNVMVDIQMLGKTIDFVVLGKGYFLDKDPDSFHISELSLNTATIPFSSNFSDRLLVLLLESLDGNDELVALKKAWKKVDSVEFADSGVRLVLD